PDARIYRNDAALPRAFLVDRQRPVDGEDAALVAISSPGFRPRTEAITERPVPGIADVSESPAGTSPGAARLTSYEPERVEVRTQARRSSLLVLTDVHYPGWRAEVDGREAPVERVDYLLRAVRVPAGAHTVEFAYRPASWRAGWIVSVVALLVLIALVLVGLRRHRAQAA
ncbi:MAG: YfhO family protein, partial [Thermoleophilaceae bacterium]|nr:YfhO family protein [Thermoleophilaceae bacterium]